MCVCARVRAQLCLTFCIVAYQAPQSLEFLSLRRPFPSLGYVPHPGIEPASLGFSALAGRLDSLPHATWEAGIQKYPASIQQDKIFNILDPNK